MKKYAKFFQKHDFNYIFCTGVDFFKKSLNIYFLLHEDRQKDMKEIC